MLDHELRIAFDRIGCVCLANWSEEAARRIERGNITVLVDMQSVSSRAQVLERRFNDGWPALQL